MKTPKKFKSVTSGKVKIYLTGTSFTLSWYAGKQRKREKRKSLEDARSRAAEINRDLDAGSGHVRSFTIQETATIENCIEMLRDIGVPISVAVREFVDGYKILGDRASVSEACRKFMEARKKEALTPIKFDDVGAEFLKRNEKQKLSEAYQISSKKFLKRISKYIGKSYIDDITAKEIGAAVDKEVSGGPRAYNNLLGAVAGVFSFARKQGYLSRTEKTEAELVERRNVDRIDSITIYTPEELHILLNNIGDDLVPFIALGGLAGIRTEEIFRMDWKMVDLKKGYILLDRVFTKTKRRRVIPINAALRSWIQPLHKSSGSIYGLSSSQALGNAIRAAWPRDKDGKLIFERRRNALRHSYGTYRFAELQDEQKVSAEMGNSPKELREHYAELATPEDAATWFAIVRETPANIVPLNIAAA
jgi:integrase